MAPLMHSTATGIKTGIYNRKIHMQHIGAVRELLLTPRKHEKHLAIKKN